MDNRVLPKIGEVPQDVNKITLVGEADLLANAQAKLVQDDSLLVSFSHTHYLEITCNTISKFNGLAYYADKLSIPIAQVIAFGDGENDIPMLSGVGLGVAMGNAKEHVKAAAKDVAGNNYEEGVANYLSKLFL
jgi:Cof subfamily protein (haloacid dehalogenase superfamily)